MELQRAKGVRDFNPEDMIMRNKVVDTLRSVFELYGFPPLETPILERKDVLAAKYAGGSEILKEMFTLKDQGDRELALRYDLTVPFSRYVGMNPTMKMPFKRYQIGTVFRDGPIKLGRYREFYQCDVDIVGCKNMAAEAELLKLAITVFEKLKLNIVIEVNNRKLLDGILDSLGINDEKKIDVILTIDKIKKIPKEDLISELKQKGMADNDIDKLLDVFDKKGSNKEKLEFVEKIVKKNEGLDELKELFSLVDSDKAELSFSLARGLAYYTGTVFEAVLKDSDFRSSLAGGGRYDNMIPEYLQTKKEFPAVGISFGLEPITEMLKLKADVKQKSVAKVFVAPIKTLKDSIKIALKLRDAGIKTDIDMMDRGVSKNLDYANYYKIPFVLILGEDEIKSGKLTLKNMDSGEEKKLSVDEVIAYLK